MCLKSLISLWWPTILSQHWVMWIWRTGTLLGNPAEAGLAHCLWFILLWCLLCLGMLQACLTERAKLRLLSSQEIISWATTKEGIKEEIFFNLNFVYGEIYYLLFACYFIIFLLENNGRPFLRVPKRKGQVIGCHSYQSSGYKRRRTVVKQSRFRRHDWRQTFFCQSKLRWGRGCSFLRWLLGPYQLGVITSDYYVLF